MKFIKIFSFIVLAFLFVGVFSASASDVTDSVTIIVTEPTAPDLVASSPSPSSAVINTSTSFNSTITNQGNYSTQWSFNVLYQVRSQANGGGSLLSESAIINRILDAGQSHSPESTFDYTFTSAGTYSVRACADMNNGSTTSSNDDVDESNEDNNCSGWTNVTVTLPAISGSCGSSNGMSFYSTPTSGYCSSGTASSVSGSGPWSWSCTGSNGGSSASCSAYKAVDGVCNASHYYCNAGASTNNSNNSSNWTWNCSGSNGGSSASCTESMHGSLTASNCVISASGSSCNTTLNWSTTNAIGTSSITTPTNTTVATGNSGSTSYSISEGSRTFYLYNNGALLATATATATRSAPSAVTGFGASASSCGNNWLNLWWNSSSGATNYKVYRGSTLVYNDSGTSFSDSGLSLGGTYSYTIYASNSAGSSSGVTTSGTVSSVCAISGSCGSSNGMSFYSTPTSGYCSSGTASSVSGSGPWSWSCTGSNGGSNASCSAYKAVDGVCNASHYYCNAGASTNNSNNSSNWTWNCSGVNYGTTASCVESKAAPSATLSIYPTTIPYGGRTTLTWSSTNATTCSTSSNWTNSGNLSGSGLTDYLTSSTSFSFQCSGNGQTTPIQSVYVTVLPPMYADFNVSTPCYISLGNSSCSIPYSWSVYNRQATTWLATRKITETSYTSIDSSNLNSGSGTMNLSYDGSPTIFYLFNNAIQLKNTEIKAYCESGTHWNGSSCILDNNAPSAPTITGNNDFYKDELQTFTITGTDPDGDQIRYGIDWNSDGVADFWSPNSLPYFNSGYSMVSDYHSWPSVGTYTFQALAQDIKGANSSWSKFTVNVTNRPLPATIDSFTVDKKNVEVGEFAKLSWTTTGATSCNMTSVPNPSVDKTNIVPNGYVSFAPTKTTIYSLICTGPGGDSPVKKLQVNVGKIKPSVTEF